MLHRFWFTILLMVPANLLAQATPLPGVFVPPFPVCQDLSDGQKLCVNAAIAASTREGRSFALDSDCSTVRTQRPFRPLPASKQGQADDPRLQDENFMEDLGWVQSQIRSSACSCCHDTAGARDYAAWDISGPNIWIEQISNRGVAILAGAVPTDLMGVYPREENFGFDRSQTGAPTTDVGRMKSFFQAELNRRGVTAEAIAQMPSGNGPFEAVLKQKPSVCAAGIGVAADGAIQWGAIPARYIYVTKADTANPLSPPKQDLPEGTLWKLDVLPSSLPLASGIFYGARAEGSKQSYPAHGAPEPLIDGQTYRLYTTRDVMRPIVNCIFTFRNLPAAR